MSEHYSREAVEQWASLPLEPPLALSKVCAELAQTALAAMDDAVRLARAQAVAHTEVEGDGSCFRCYAPWPCVWHEEARAVITKWSTT